MNISEKTFFTVSSALILVAIASTAYTFLIRKNYEFIIESSCDPTVDVCFYRDCEIEECPPNGLEHFRMFSMSAADFETCADETCLTECTTGVIACTEIMCGESEDDVCSPEQ